MGYPKGQARRQKPKQAREFIAEPIVFGSGTNIAQSSGLFARLKGKPFWGWDEETGKGEDHIRDGDCCFNHIIGLPKNKPGLPENIFDFQKQFHDALFERTHDKTDKHIWIKKPTGIGGTAIYLRLMVWLATRNDDLKGSHMCILTGPNQSLANDLIKRIRELFIEFPEVEFPINSTTRLEINGVMFQAYPSNHMDAMRGIDKISFILGDEFAFFGKKEEESENPRTIIERYVGKWDPWIVIMSTANLKDDMFGLIEFEKDPIYKRLFIPYEVGVGKVYTVEEITRVKATPSFKREYQGEYLGVFGDYFKPESIELAEKQGNEMDLSYISQETRKVMGVDAGFGSSAFGIVITQLNQKTGKIQIIYAEDFERPDFNDMIDLILKLKNQYVIEKIYVDSANVPVITSLKRALREREDYHVELAKIKHKHPPDPARWMDVVPVAFNTEGRDMLLATYMMLDMGWLAINSKFSKLLIALRTARAREGQLDKNSTAHDDILDALRMALKRYSLPETK